MSAIRDRLPGWGGGGHAVSSHRSAPGMPGAISAAVRGWWPPCCVITGSGAVTGWGAVTGSRAEARVAEEVMGWSCDAGELAACFTAHSRDLFGYACVLSDADRALAGDLVQAAFEAAATAWCTLRGLPADQCRHWLREKLAAEAQSRTGHPAGSALVSPSHRRLTELKMARYRSDYDATAGLDRFAGWLRTRADGARPAPGSASPACAPRPAAQTPAASRTGPGPTVRTTAAPSATAPQTTAPPMAAPAMGGGTVPAESGQLPRQGVTVTR